jgi:hypothetical protein
VDRAFRTSVMHYREYVYDVISPEMLVECWYLMHIRTREWRAANIAFYKLLGWYHSYISETIFTCSTAW